MNENNAPKLTMCEPLVYGLKSTMAAEECNEEACHATEWLFSFAGRVFIQM